ncbi:hypothetical protein [Niveispirillum cyanobacteriorum]|uniref:Uncharacterized protein n=1 Tax=Niveispirillum cyanobacteriorum TaxID=1612173 RepID=A0A2K9NGM0_9PROT|nr:hypothetical protein [Niveispirillum cyanobacteriorum]AUN32233.1 hypothetical protein C0V82_17700 [Niveispirillum cyanobacteriorum]GGE75439.1 hypothetical protein GCM10011317_35690 [Niveispirillum cyanobacteriorum]
MRINAKLWVGVGLCVAMGQTGMAMAQDHHAGHGAAVPAAAEGGEGGELGAFDNLSEDQQLQGSLGLIRGHLSVGRELYNAGRGGDAIPHFLHPAEEIYDGARPVLDTRKAGFEAELDALVALARAKAPVADVVKALETVEKAIAKAEATIAAADRAKPAFLTPVIATLLRTAASEYAAAVEDGVITSPIEYQDGRGFYAIAKVYLHRLAASAATSDPSGNAAKAMDKLAPVWATLQPPKGKVTPPGEVSAMVSNVELALSRLR